MRYDCSPEVFLELLASVLVKDAVDTETQMMLQVDWKALCMQPRMAGSLGKS